MLFFVRRKYKLNLSKGGAPARACGQMTNKRLDQIRKRIAQIKAALAAIDDMRPGSLTRQYKDPKNQSGPYYQLSYTRQMKSRTEYVARENVREVRREIANYKRFKALSEEWVDFPRCQTSCRLRMKLARSP
jgi:ribosomal protein L29